MGTELTGAQIEEVDDATTDGASPVGTSTAASESEQHSTSTVLDSVIYEAFSVTEVQGRGTRHEHFIIWHRNGNHSLHEVEES